MLLIQEEKGSGLQKTCVVLYCETFCKFKNFTWIYFITYTIF